MDTKLTITRKDGIIVGTINNSDRLNATIAPEIKDQLNNQINNSDVSFVLDLQNIKFIDSSGIAVLISALKTARQKSQNFYLANIQKEVKELLCLMKLDKVFDFYDQ